MKKILILLLLINSNNIYAKVRPIEKISGSSANDITYTKSSSTNKKISNNEKDLEFSDILLYTGAGIGITSLIPQNKNVGVAVYAIPSGLATQISFNF